MPRPDAHLRPTSSGDRSPSTLRTTTPIDPTGLSIGVRRPRPARLPLWSGLSTPPGYEESTAWAASSRSTGWSPELGGRALGTHMFEEITEKAIRRGTHRSIKELADSVTLWVGTWNENLCPYVWHKTDDENLESLGGYLTRIADSRH